MYLRPACILLTLLVACTSLHSIELFLKNGDRLQGELISESDDHLTIDHPILGEIEIAKNKLAEMPDLSPKKAEATAVAQDEKKGEPGPKETPGRRESKEVPTPGEPELAGKDDGGFIEKIPKYVWNSPKELGRMFKQMNAKLGFSFSDKSSVRDLTNLRFFYNSKWKNGKSEYRLDTEYRLSTRDELTIEDRYTGDFRFRREQGTNFFIQASTFYRADPVREIKHWVEQGVGGGWTYKSSPSFQFSLGAEANVKHEDLSDNGKAINGVIGGTNFLTTFFEDSVYKIGTNYQLTQEAQYFVNPNHSDNWGYRFNAKLDGKIISGFSVRLSYEYSFDNLVPRKNIPQKESLLSTALLYTF